jgi:ABC-type multidrug transport system ATPase subunit
VNTLDCSDVTCRFNGTLALDHVDITVGRGELVGLIGQNGAGKTTLLNAISGIVSPQKGRVRLNGVDVTRRSFRQRAAAGLVRSFEDTGIWKGLPVVDNVSLGGYGQPLEEARRLATRVLASVGLSDYLHEAAGTLSIGLRRRMELAKILLRKEVTGASALIVLDEPMRGLDESAKTVMVDLLREHLVGHCAILMVEHDREVAEKLSSRLIYLQNGRVSLLPATETVDPSGGADSERTQVDQSAPSVQLRNVHAGYSTEDVLKGVDLSVGRNEAVQIVGPNGAGKSTLLRVLVGGVEPRRGTIEVLGKNVGPTDSRLQLGIGYAPQGGRLVRYLPVRTHIELAQKAATGRVNLNLQRRFHEMFPEAKVLMPLRCGELSSGQRSLVALWTAIATEPVVLVADEPGAGLAPDLRRRIYDFLRSEYLNDGRSLLVVEHGTRLPWARPVSLLHGLAVQGLL